MTGKKMPIDDFTVHIVDDEEAVRKSLAFMLTMNGFGVRVHESATAFLALAAGLRQAVLKQVSGAKALIVPANWAQVNDVVVRNMDRIFRPSANVRDELNQVCNDINPLLR